MKTKDEVMLMTYRAAAQYTVRGIDAAIQEKRNTANGKSTAELRGLEAMRREICADHINKK